MCVGYLSFSYLHILFCWLSQPCWILAMVFGSQSAACFLLLFTDRNRAGTGCLCQTAVIRLTLFKIHTCCHPPSTSPPSFMLYEPYLATTALRFVIMEIPPTLSSVTCSKQLSYKHLGSCCPQMHWAGKWEMAKEPIVERAENWKGEPLPLLVTVTECTHEHIDLCSDWAYWDTIPRTLI